MRVGSVIADIEVEEEPPPPTEAELGNEVATVPTAEQELADVAENRTAPRNTSSIEELVELAAKVEVLAANGTVAEAVGVEVKSLMHCYFSVQTCFYVFFV